MKPGRHIEVTRHRIHIRKADIGMAFFDTFFWEMLLQDEQILFSKICKYCLDGKLQIVINDMIHGELVNRNLYKEIDKSCKPGIVRLASGQIRANQIIQALYCYLTDKQNIDLSWNHVKTDVPILKSLDDIKKKAEAFVSILNHSYYGKSLKPKDIIPSLVRSERKTDTDMFKVYHSCLKHDHDKGIIRIKQDRNYRDFFFSDAYVDLPAIMIKYYSLAAILRQRKITINDILDVFTYSELAVYTNVYILDKAQHNNLLQLNRKFPSLFNRLLKNVRFESKNRCTPYDPVETIESYLIYLGQRQ